ncbi:lipid-A-disaccharide synthase [Maritalea mediterranea]|uniref:Lipid-A-disaccharide synthase n=1 Tax=Maritalea mediterranea TaxID=2909667 RepID=A0ABS9E6V5_9HYPH|nr:lipid-A-disaccharide synthase [Maritalea mediterranea]MCF4098552.1 lipid-A-disaccharide synthase [Maritalea mediterranea]
MRLFVVAGESSGDKLAAGLVDRLAEQKDVELFGVGGPALQAAGVKTLFPMSDLAVMGWRDVYLRLPLLLWRLKQTVDAIVRQKPDIVLLVDSQEFSQRVAAGVRKHLPNVPIILYVAPSVWAWRPERAAKIRPLYNEILSVLPFEPKVFEKLGGPSCTYVGHSGERLSGIGANEKSDHLLLLPGSRQGELDRNLGSLLKVAADLQEFDQIDLATVEHLRSRLIHQLKGHDISVTSGRAAFEAALSRAKMALAVSGTVTLELAFADVPHVLFYVADKKLGAHYEQAGRPLVGLPNILLGRELVPEIVGTTPRLAELGHAAELLAQDEPTRARQRDGFAEIRELMQKGAPEAPRQDPVDRILSYL